MTSELTPLIGLSNLGISAAYAALGNRAQLPIAIAAMFAVPLVIAAVARWFWLSVKDDVP